MSRFSLRFQGVGGAATERERERSHSGMGGKEDRVLSVVLSPLNTIDTTQHSYFS
jgi:hypothetical protein